MVTLVEVAAHLGLAIHIGVGSEETSVANDPVVIDVTHDSRQVVPGSIFCCLKGDHFDGHHHAADAVVNGAVALMCDHELPIPVPQLISESVRTDMSRAADLVWGHPSSRLRMVGVTGTNGKTTIVSMISWIMTESGIRSEMIGTLTGQRTTPESTDLQRQLAELVDDGADVVAMEVSSHALVQHRVDDVSFDLALFTNLGRDHLDFHGTQEAYFAAKALLFEPALSHKAIVNVDDVHGRLLADAASIPTVRVSLGDVTDLNTTPSGTTFTWHGCRFSLPMAGSHNVSNALLAASACLELGLELEAIAAGLATLPQVPGRFQVFNTTPESGLPGFSAVVDYAHTPDALECTLDAARELAGGDSRVIVVFGCGGDRDREKRPMMGAIAASKADVAIVTSDNPRSEDPRSIIDQIVAGVGGTSSGGNVRPGGSQIDSEDERVAELVVNEDRRSAIETALSMAGDGDVVLVAGKGHETGQTAGGHTEPFDDREVVATFISKGRPS